MSPRLLKWGAIGLVIVVVVLLVLPVVSMLQPDYYRRYPALGQRMDHWATSTHSQDLVRGMPRRTRAPRGSLTFAAASVPAFYSQLFSGPIEHEPARRPHAGQRARSATRATGGWPRAATCSSRTARTSRCSSIECVACHKDLVHSLNRRGFNRPEMEGCLEQCHDGDTASNECIDCHTRKETPAIAQEDGLARGPRAHGGDRRLRVVPRLDARATAPSATRSARPRTWATGRRITGPLAKQRGDGCLVCHGGEKFCKECH